MCNGVLMLIRFSVAFRDAYDKDRLDDAQWNRSYVRILWSIARFTKSIMVIIGLRLNDSLNIALSESIIFSQYNNTIDENKLNYVIDSII